MNELKPKIVNLKLEAELAKAKRELWCLSYDQALYSQLHEICEDLALSGSHISDNQGPWPFAQLKLQAANYANHMLAKLNVRPGYVH